VIVGNNDQKAIDKMAEYGVHRLYFLEHSLLSIQNAELYSRSLSLLFQEKVPVIVIFGATIFGNDLAGRVAALMKTGLVIDCTDLSLDEQGMLSMTRLTHGSRISSTYICPKASIQLTTITPGIFDKKPAKKKVETEIEVFKPDLDRDEARIRITGRIKADPDSITLDEADIIISGGRGMGNRENFQLVSELARKLGGVTGASLGAVDEEMAPRKCLVGQTGTTVLPDLYVACGISGSIYHVLGMKDSKAIVAINKDANADIFKYSDMGLVGDAVEIIKSINAKIGSSRGKPSHDQ